MESIRTRRTVAALIVVALAVGAALPALGGAAVRAAKATIGTAQLKNGAVTNAKVRPGSLRYTAFAKGQVARADLKGIRAGGVLTGMYPQPGLANGSVRAAQIATNAVGRSEIAAGAVGSEELAAGAVRASDIANGSIGASKIAPNSIGRGQIAPGGVGASEIARGAVGVSELAPLPGARVYRTAPFSIPHGRIVEVPMTDAAYTQGGTWSSAAPTRLTAPVDGVYQVTGSVLFQGNGAGARGVWIVNAGNPDVQLFGEQQAAVTEAGQASELNISGIVRLAAGDAIALAVRQASGGDLAVLGTGQQTSIALQFLSP
ncbi:MAG: hypothetical protein ACR2JV_03700 [Gaiellales bacterium]